MINRYIALPILLLLVVVTFSSCSGHNRRNIDLALEQRKTEIITNWDFNRDGIINCRDTFLKRAYDFMESDLDKNAVLDSNEFRQAPWGSKAFAQEYLNLYDVNGDLVVTLVEFQKRQDQQFSNMDTDNNCTITESEIIKALGVTGSESEKPIMSKKMGIVKVT